MAESLVGVHQGVAIQGWKGTGPYSCIKEKVALLKGSVVLLSVFKIPFDTPPRGNQSLLHR